MSHIDPHAIGRDIEASLGDFCPDIFLGDVRDDALYFEVCHAIAGTGKGKVQRLQRECLTNVQRRDDSLDRIEVAEAEAEELSLDLG